LLAGAGVALDEDPVDELVDRTEGWPAGLYLAALAINAGSPVESSLSLTGDDRFVGDYLRSELLRRVSRADVSFLTRTSILERMSGPMCDVIAGRGSSRINSGAGHNLLVLCWTLESSTAITISSRAAPRRADAASGDGPGMLHTHAAAWCEANDLPRIGHRARPAADDVDRSHGWSSRSSTRGPAGA
jgi:LuxR family maltose regulon positive regulatory protein